MNKTRGATKKLTNPRVCIFNLEGEMKSYIDALAASRNVSQSTVLRDMITYWADGHKI